MTEGVEPVVDRVAPADADERAALGTDPESLERLHPAGHDPLAAGLVDHPIVRVDDEHGEARARSVDRRGEARRPAASDDQIEDRASAHPSLAREGTIVESASSSVRIRTARSHAFSRVKASAVIHAEWMSGSAMPSSTTAT